MSRKIKLEDELDNWLDQHGGRVMYDLEYDEKGKSYVTMWSGIYKTWVKYYLPKHLQY